MPILAGAKVDAVDFDLPDPVAGYGAGTNAITAGSFTDLPTNNAVVSIVNPHPSANLLCQVHFGVWITISGTATFVRACPRVSGATTIAAGISSVNAGPIGWGAIPGSNLVGINQCSGFATYSLPPGTSTFTMQGYRDSAAGGTYQINYPVIHVTPVNYVF